MDLLESTRAVFEEESVQRKHNRGILRRGHMTYFMYCICILGLDEVKRARDMPSNPNLNTKDLSESQTKCLMAVHSDKECNPGHSS